MNGEPLTPDHGAPVRLVVPGWYGCSWIKWVNEIRLVGADEPIDVADDRVLAAHASARRSRSCALDYEPPAIDLAATPIRVEKRRVNGRLEYRIVGIVWGGDRPVDRLMIRFRAGEHADAVHASARRRARTAPGRCGSTAGARPAPGVYSIALTAADPAIRTRRLDVSFYVRRV